MVAATEPMQRVRQLPTRVFHLYMRFSDPTPLRSPISSPSAQGCHSTYKTHGLRRQIIALINHRLFTQRALTQSNSLCLTSDVRCSRSSPPLLTALLPDLQPKHRPTACSQHNSAKMDHQGIEPRTDRL